MCELGFGFVGIDFWSIYNRLFEPFAWGSIGTALILKTLVLQRVLRQTRIRWILASLTTTTTGAVFLTWYPIGWLVVIELWKSFEAEPWCGTFVLLSSLVSAGMDLGVLRLGLGWVPTGRGVGWICLANLLSLLVGTGLALYEDLTSLADY